MELVVDANILVSGLIAKKEWGYKGAIITIIFLFISPRFIGHSLNNNKDIPWKPNRRRSLMREVL